MKSQAKMDYLFLPSGCLTGKSLESYAAGLLDADERTVIESHLSGCEFCKDAMDGYFAFDEPQSFARVTEELASNIDTRIGKEENNWLPFLRRKYAILAAAASFLLLAGLFFLLVRKPPAESISLQIPATGKITTSETSTPDSSLPGKQLALAESSKTAESKPAPGIRSHVEPTGKPKQAYKEPAKKKDLSYPSVMVTPAPGKEAAEKSDVVDKLPDSVGLPSAVPMDNGHPGSGAVVPERTVKDLHNDAKSESNQPVMLSSRKLVLQTKMNADKDEDGLYYEVAEMPQFQGKGIVAFEKYLEKSLEKEYHAVGNETIVSLSFIVEKDGRAGHAKVMQSADTTMNDPLIKLVNGSPAWKPGYQDGKPVRVKLAVTVTITPN